jgi:hypothetical protein
MYHAALADEPNVKGFTLMLSKPVEALARSKGKHCLRWLHKRFVRALKPLGDRYMNGAVPFWFVIEESDKGRLHIHGEISIGDVALSGRSIRSLRRVLEPIRQAMKSAGGVWDFDRDGEGTQLRFARGTPDFRWAGYCLKDVHKASPARRRFMRQFKWLQRQLAGFGGKAVTASRGVHAHALLLHSSLRP